MREVGQGALPQDLSSVRKADASPIPYSLFLIPYSLFPIPYSLFFIPYSLLIAAGGQFSGGVTLMRQFSSRKISSWTETQGAGRKVVPLLMSTSQS